MLGPFNLNFILVQLTPTQLSLTRDQLGLRDPQSRAVCFNDGCHGFLFHL